MIHATFRLSLKITPDRLTSDVFWSADMYLLTQELLNQMFGEDEEVRKQIIILAMRDDLSYVFASVLITVTRESRHSGCMTLARTTET